MTDSTDTGRDGTEQRLLGMASATSEVDAWFVREVLPLEATLMKFLRRNWRNASEAPDLLQEIYAHVYAAALKQIPETPRAFVFATARNLLINLMRRDQIVAIEAVADLDALSVAAEEPGPDRNAESRAELRRLQDALDTLPRRAREAFMLRHVDGLSRREIATRMGVSEKTVKWHLGEGLRAIADILHGRHEFGGGKP